MSEDLRPEISGPEVSGRPVRIFWFGAHKLLVNTELARLRHLGFEVFNPPYLSQVLDQSAVTTWDRDQRSTLPPDVFEALSEYDYFYRSIDPEIVDLINTHFDAVVVTIVARWATEFLRFFKGPILYRTYGQTALVSDNFEACGGRALIEQHPNFHFMPHDALTGEAEADWLRQRMTVVPYCLSDDIFANRGTWMGDGVAGEILVTAPNILGNVFHRSHYDFLKEFFYHDHFRFMGVQPLGRMVDPQVVGSLHRSEQLAMFRRAAGSFYSYRDPRVCYLPPVEMMVFGGPVIYLSGSLLAAYIGRDGPGEAGSITEARRKCAWLRAPEERRFVDEVQTAQAGVVDRYDPALVWPVFDAVMLRLLPRNAAARPLEERTPAGLLAAVSPYWAGLRQRANSIVAALSDPGDASHAGGEAGVAAVLPCLAPIPALDIWPPFDDVVGRRDLLVEAPAGTGRWTTDRLTNRRARLSRAGVGEDMHYGPYIKLASGRYEVRFVLRADGPDGVPAAVVDVLGGNEVAFVQKVTPTGTETQTIRAVFQVADPATDWEFRVITTGAAEVHLFAVTLQEIGQAVPEQIEGPGRLVTGGLSKVGKWIMDPNLNRPARYAAPEEEGCLHYGPYDRLEPGAYEACFVLRADRDGGASAIGRVDVAMAGKPLVQQPLQADGGRLQFVRQRFMVAADDPGVEFRVFANRSEAGLYLYCIQLEALPAHG